MYLSEKLKSLESKIVFMTWDTSAEYGKIKFVGHDYVEFDVIDRESLDYSKSILINPNMILEIVMGSTEVNRLIAAVSCKLPAYNNKTGANNFEA